MRFDLFLLNFLKRSKKFSLKFILGLCQLDQQNKPSLFITLTSIKKPWSDSRNLMKKKTKLHHFSKNRDQIDTKKNLRTNLLFLKENRNQKSNCNIPIK